MKALIGTFGGLLVVSRVGQAFEGGAASIRLFQTALSERGLGSIIRTHPGAPRSESGRGGGHRSRRWRRCARPGPRWRVVDCGSGRHPCRRGEHPPGLGARCGRTHRCRCGRRFPGRVRCSRPPGNTGLTRANRAYSGMGVGPDGLGYLNSSTFSGHELPGPEHHGSRCRRLDGGGECHPESARRSHQRPHRLPETSGGDALMASVTVTVPGIVDGSGNQDWLVGNGSASSSRT
jgi:hypothetical protein